MENGPAAARTRPADYAPVSHLVRNAGFQQTTRTRSLIAGNGTEELHHLLLCASRHSPLSARNVRYLPRTPTTTKLTPAMRDRPLRIGEIGSVLFTL